jgi:Flp pilus assembly protein TadD
VDVPRGSPWLVPVLTLAAVLGIVAATYWPALSAGALYMDDKFYLGPITRHPGWASVKAIFGEILSPSMVNGYYQPLSLLSMMLDFLDPAASSSLLPFHRTTLLLHLMNVALVVALLRALFGKWHIAGLLGLLYGVHPLNADAVLWIAERKTVLSTCFALSSLLLYVAHARHVGRTHHLDWKRYGASLLLYICAVLSKPTTLPVATLLPLLDYWPLGRLDRKAWLEKVPFLLVMLISAVVTILSQAAAGGAGQTQFMKPLYVPLILGYSVGFYLLKLALPRGLVSDYPSPQPLGLENPEVLGCLIIAVGVVVAIVMFRKRTRAWLTGGLFFLIAILPTLGIVRFTSSITANRSMYLPMVGLLIPLAWQMGRWWDRGVDARKRTVIRGSLVGGVALLALGCVVASRGYQAHWSDSVALLRYYISQKPAEWKFHTRLGNEWISRRDYRAAITEFREAARLHGNWAENHLNLGRALFTTGDYEGARRAFVAALQQDPRDWRTHMLLGSTLLRQQDLDGALEAFGRAGQLAPKSPLPHFNIANILMEQGKLDAAAEEYRHTLRLEPRFAEAQRALDKIAAKTSGTQ